MISGFTIARNVGKLEYPIRQCVSALARIVDEVVIAYDPTSEDATKQICEKIQRDFTNTKIKLIESVWDMSTLDNGREVGRQTDVAMAACSYDWVLYCQLDEAFHEDERARFHQLVETAPLDVIGFSCTRPYFFGDLETIRRDWSITVIRLVRKDAVTFGTLDGHTCEPARAGRVVNVPDLWMFHYSRMGDAKTISKRIRNLDTFFHQEDTLIPEQDLPEYDFKTREFDNYSKIESPAEVEGTFVKYTGIHPEAFGSLFSKGPSYRGKSAPYSHYR